MIVKWLLAVATAAGRKLLYLSNSVPLRSFPGCLGMIVWPATNPVSRGRAMLGCLVAASVPTKSSISTTYNRGWDGPCSPGISPQISPT